MLTRNSASSPRFERYRMLLRSASMTRHARRSLIQDDPGDVRPLPVARRASPFFFREDLSARHWPEIGRASGRARVCQYVEISVAGVSFKKKIKKQNTTLRIIY